MLEDSLKAIADISASEEAAAHVGAVPTDVLILPAMAVDVLVVIGWFHGAPPALVMLALAFTHWMITSLEPLRVSVTPAYDVAKEACFLTEAVSNVIGPEVKEYSAKHNLPLEEAIPTWTVNEVVPDERLKQ